MGWFDHVQRAAESAKQPSTTQQASGTQTQSNPYDTSQSGQQQANPYSGNYQQDWNDFVTSKGYTAQDARTYLPNWAAEFNAMHPGAGVYATGRPGDYDTIYVPGTGIVDIATSGNQWWWGPEGPEQQQPGYGGTPQGAYGQSAGLSGLTYSPWQQDPRNQSLWNMLMDRSGQSLIPTANNPVIKAQTDAFRAEQERGARNYLNDIAEQNGPFANNSTEARMAHEKAAQNTATMQGQLLQNEVSARRTEIAQALQEMGALLSDDQRLALQKELAYLNNDQFLRNLGLEAEDRASYWDAIRSGRINL